LITEMFAASVGWYWRPNCCWGMAI